ncbi:MAG: FAD-dependent oxidoreductase [Planctomycetes bacterium]|nr:FAD-dependent oxidoreductase [Planctomycetota bacterium]
MIDVDILVVGGGCSGSAAAWQAARLGRSVLVVEPSRWWGGMVGPAGVCALDGNKGARATGFLRRFRDAIEARHGGPRATYTGWISETCFHPRDGHEICRDLVAESGAAMRTGVELDAVLVDGRRILGARLRAGAERFDVRARVTIEATEFGDVLLRAGVPSRLGRESRAQTGEPHAPAAPDDELQDLTWVAILERAESGAAPPVSAPPGHDPRAFDGCLAAFASHRDEAVWNHGLHSWESFIGYATLPGGRYMLNWPFHANDFPARRALFDEPSSRPEAFAAARRRTLSFVHFVQTTLGRADWGLAPDAFDGGEPGLALIPYVRECRRVIGVNTMREQDVVPARPGERLSEIHDAIAIGDYFLDHHHSRAHRPPGERLVEDYPANAPFQVPYGCLVPAEHDGLLVAEKSISVTHVVNGCTRLQPVAFQLGQAAGAGAALAVAAGCQPRAVPVADVQAALRAEGSRLSFAELDPS